MQLALESPDQPDVIKLIDELDAFQRSLYPPESCHLLDLASLTKPNVLFVVARDSGHVPIATGAVVIQPEYGELKRMYVHPRGRGQGIARAILTMLEQKAIESGCAILMLESGPLQHEALRLYYSSGFERCGPYGDYENDPLSVFMKKRIIQ
jgi:putative acetyltransferase